MKFKLDENLAKQAVEILRTEGYDVTTVSDQKMLGATDKALIETCRTEGRCLVTLDLEFGNPLLFKPSRYAGIVVIRLPHKPSLDDLLDILRTFVGILGKKDLCGKLWIVQKGRVREYQPDSDNF